MSGSQRLLLPRRYVPGQTCNRSTASSMKRSIGPASSGRVDKTDEKWRCPIETDSPIYSFRLVRSYVVWWMESRCDLTE